MYIRGFNVVFITYRSVADETVEKGIPAAVQSSTPAAYACRASCPFFWTYEVSRWFSFL